MSEGMLADGQDITNIKFRIRDYTTLEQVDNLHRNVEVVKKNLSEDTDYMTEEMSALIAKVNSAIQTAQNRQARAGSGAKQTQDQDVRSPERAVKKA